MPSRLKPAVFFIALLLLSCRLMASPPAGYYEVWGDEFNGTALDTTKWDFWLLGNRRDAVNVTNAVSLNGSNLVITTYTSNSVNYTAIVATDQKFLTKYGYWESSIKWGDTNGMWSAFWMQSSPMANGTYNIWDPSSSGSEIDIDEHRYVDGSANNINNYVQANIHWNGYGTYAASAGSGNVNGGISLGSGFHTYGFLWTANSYAFSADGTTLYTGGSAPVSHNSEWTIFSSEVDDTSTTWAGTIPSGGYGSLANSSTKLYVDYCRYYASTNTLFWTGGSSLNWTNSGNWVSSLPLTSLSDMTFSYLSGNNLATVLGTNVSIHGLVYLDMNNGSSISSNTLTLGAGGIDALSANHTVTINSGINIGADQSWIVGGSYNFVVNGPVSGSSALTKDGPGTLLLTGTNTFNGTLYMDTGISSTNSDGAIRITSTNAIAAVASPIYFRNGASASSALYLDGSAGSMVVTQNFSVAGRTTTSGSIINYAGTNTIAGNVILAAGGNIFTLESDAGLLAFTGACPQNSLGTQRFMNFQGSGNLAVNSSIGNGTGGGTVGVTKYGSGTLTLNASNTFTGGLTNYGGVIVFNTNGSAGRGAVVSDTGTSTTGRLIIGNGVTVTNAIVANTVNAGGGTIGLIMANDNTTATVSGPVTFYANATAGGHFAGPTTSGLLTISGAVTANATNFLVIRAGYLRFSGGGSYSEIQDRANATSIGANNGISTSAVLDIGGNGSTTVPTLFDLNGFNQTLAGLKNAVTSANVAWVTNSSATAGTLTLNVGTTNYSFGGSIVGPVALTLNSGVQVLSNGVAALNGLYTYTGNTTVNGGRLTLASGISLPNTPVISIASGGVFDVSASGFTLAHAQTLTGAGAVAGNLTVNGTIAPGNNGLGVLTCSNNVTCSSTATNNFQVNKTLATNDQLNVKGTLTLAGTLVVSNLSGTLASGDAFKLFSATAYSGGFASYNLPVLTSGLGWDTSTLGTDGTVRIVSTVNTVSTNIVMSISGSTLTLSWPSDHTGWRLQVQTNTLGQGLGTNWFDVPSSTNVNQMSFPLNPSNEGVFFRMIYP